MQITIGKITGGASARDLAVHRGYGVLGEKPTVNDAEVLRPDVCVSMSPAADAVEAALTAVIAWPFVRLCTAMRSLELASRRAARVGAARTIALGTNGRQ